jgi:hypothetical protein
MRERLRPAPQERAARVIHLAAPSAWARRGRVRESRDGASQTVLRAAALKFVPYRPK